MLPVDFNKTTSIIKKLHLLLEKGGKILIMVPNISSLWGLKVFLCLFNHVTPFTPERINELVQITGYKCTRIVGQGTGKKRKRIAQNILHFLLSRILTYHPDI